MIIVIKLVLVHNNIVFIFVLFVLFCIVIFVIIQQYFLFVQFPVLRLFRFESLSVVIAYKLNFFCYSFVGFECVYGLVHQSVFVFCFVFRRRSAVKFFLFVNVSNVLQVFVMYLNLRVYLFVSVLLFFCCCVVTSLYLPLYRFV